MPSVITGMMGTSIRSLADRFGTKETPLWSNSQVSVYTVGTLRLRLCLQDCLTLALNTDQQRLQGGLRKLIGAINGDLSNRGLPKDTMNQSLARFGGINIYGFDPQQARQDSIRYGREG